MFFAAFHFSEEKRQTLSVNTDIVDVWENMKEGGSGGVKVNV